MIPHTLIEDFSQKWEEAMQNLPEMDGYARQYLQYLFEKRHYYLRIYSAVLNEVHLHAEKSSAEMAVVDYGCGNGMLGIFARFCGYGKVFFQDTNPAFLEAARAMAQGMNISNTDFVPGELNRFLERGLFADAVIATDVIEHIYKPDDFFSAMKSINPKMISVCTTAANPFNIISRIKSRKLQIKDELKGHKGAGDLSGPSHPPYLQTRKEMIRSAFPELKAVEKLAECTRGLAGEDIIAAVQQYMLTKHLPQPASGTNTCDPVTGSFTERILTVSQYQQLYTNNGFTLNIKAGFYDEYRNGSQNLRRKMANGIVRILGKKFSPFIILIGRKNL